MDKKLATDNCYILCYTKEEMEVRHLGTTIFDPKKYTDFLPEYMEQAYEALEKNDKLHYALAVINITGEVKYLVKSEELAPEEGERIKEYFWRQVE